MKTSSGSFVFGKQSTLLAVALACAACVTSSKAAIITSASFAPRIDFESQRDPGSPVLADLDGDGKLDVAVVVYQSHLLTIRRNTTLSGVGAEPARTSAILGPRIDLPAGPNPAHVAAADLDGDGKLDLVVANDYGGNVSVYQNRSPSPGVLNAESFSRPVHFAADTHPISTAIGDLDGDGKLELAVANAVHGQSTVSVYKNLTRPGVIDNNSFASEIRFPVGHYAFNIAMGDLDGDGRADLVIANIETHNISILRNTTSSSTGRTSVISFAPKVDLPVSANSRAFDVALGDLDADGKLDIAVAHDNGVSIFRNASSPGPISARSFAPRHELSFPDEIGYEVAIGDLDGDGKPDLGVTVNWAPTLSVYQNFSRAGSLEFGSRVTLPGMANSIAIGDINRDGKNDIVSVINPAVSIHLNQMPRFVDPVLGIEQLIQVLLASDLGRKYERPLLASLEAAKASFEAGRPEVAFHQLKAFQSKVEAQLARLNPDLAAQLTNMAQDIIDGQAPRRVYDLAQDFSLASNPAGAWTYGYSATLGGTFVPFAVKKYNYDSAGVPVEVWCIATWTVPAVQRNATDRTVTSDGGQGVYPPGTVWYYPGPSNRDDGGYNPNDNYGVLRFTVPPDESGEYLLSTAVRSAYTGPISGDTDFHVLVNGREVFGRFLPREGSASFQDRLTLNAGDTVDFVIGRGADDSFHGSGLIIDATLTQIERR